MPIIIDIVGLEEFPGPNKFLKRDEVRTEKNESNFKKLDNDPGLKVFLEELMEKYYEFKKHYDTVEE